MVRRLAAFLALTMTSFVVTPALVAPARAADDYTSKVRTSCHLTLPAAVAVGTPPRIRVHVRPNGPAARGEQPTGTVTVTITQRGTRIFTRTAAYHGSPITIVGPVITEPGHYVVHARFRAADGSVFRNCQDTTSLDVREGTDGDDEPTPPPGGNGGDEIPEGLLPDTGGPDQRWLLLGLGLVLGGLGLVAASRDRRRSPYPV